MKFNTISPTLFASEASFDSSTPLEKRVTITDKANIGFTTLNGGTSSGRSFIPVAITLDALRAVVQGNVAKIVLISDTIQGTEMGQRRLQYSDNRKGGC
ncbi:Pectate lyase, partial [Rhizoctonia solani]